MKEPTLVIMAAGMGSRFGGLKQITPISGKDEVILDFSLYDAMMAGFNKAVIVIREENLDDFKKLLENKAMKHMDIRFAFQKLDNLPNGYKVPEGRVKPWGTSHAVLSAKEYIDGPFCVINADDYYGPSAFNLIYDFLTTVEDKEKYNYAMVGYKIENTLTENGSVSRGICVVDKDNNLENIVERTKIMLKDGEICFTEDDGKTFTGVNKGTTVSMNFFGFTHSFLDELEKEFPEFLDKMDPLKSEYPLPTSVDKLIKANKANVKVLNTKDRWYGVTYKEDKDSIVSALQALKDQGIYPEKLFL